MATDIEKGEDNMETIRKLVKKKEGGYEEVVEVILN